MLETAKNTCSMHNRIINLENKIKRKLREEESSSSNSSNEIETEIAITQQNPNHHSISNESNNNMHHDDENNVNASNNQEHQIIEQQITINSTGDAPEHQEEQCENCRRKQNNVSEDPCKL